MPSKDKSSPAYDSWEDRETHGSRAKKSASAAWAKALACDWSQGAKPEGAAGFDAWWQASSHSLAHADEEEEERVLKELAGRALDAGFKLGELVGYGRPSRAQKLTASATRNEAERLAQATRLAAIIASPDSEENFGAAPAAKRAKIPPPRL